jgi:hypothetical protein
MIATAATLLLMAAPPQAKPPASGAPVAVVAAPQPSVAGPSPAMVGGYVRMDAHTAELHTALHAAVAAITPARHPGARLVSAQHQIVAGTNYRMKIKLRDGSLWQATVWHKLDGQYQVTEVVRLD